ncbi:tetratricopeptide repeat protein 28-like [Montipora capricornis]|uniref:tetratricopeptide repeat protein 28-like n=1 Tax=Montipora capricornis TaxID=246305 RepID=UPI0035F214BC
MAIWALLITVLVGDRAIEGAAYGSLGNAYQSLGSFKEAMEYHHRHLSIAKEVGDRAEEGKAYCNLGNAYDILGNLKQAIEYHHQDLSIAKEVGDRAGEGAAYGNIGNAYQSLGNFKRAIDYHHRLLSIAKEVGDRAREGATYGNLGNDYQTIEYHHQDLRIAKEVEDRAGEGRAYFNLANAYDSLRNFKQAIEYHHQHLSIAKEEGNRAREGAAYGNLGNAYQSLGNFKQAIVYHHRRLSIAKEVGDRAGEGAAYEVGDRAGEGAAYGNLGTTYHVLGNFKQAIEYYHQRLSIAKEVGDRAGEGRAYCNLGIAYRNLGNFKQAIEYHHQHLSIAKEQAIEYHHQNLSIAKEVGDRAREGATYGNLGNAYQSLGNFKQAIEYHHRRLSIVKEVGDRAGEGAAYGNLGNAHQSLEVGDRDGEGAAYGNLGNAYQRLGNFKQAIEYHHQHLSIAKEVGARAEEGAAYGNLGNAYQSLGNFKQAIEYHHRRLSIAKEIGGRAGEGPAYGNLGNAYQSLGNFKAGEGTAYGNLGVAYQSLGNFKQAVEYHYQHFSIVKEVGDRAREGAAYCNLGIAYRTLGNFKLAIEYHHQRLSIAKEKAIQYHHQDLRICKETEDPVALATACYHIGVVHEFFGSLSKALNYYRLSIYYFDEVRRLLLSEDAWKISFRDTKGFAYTALWTALLKNGEVDEALYAAEQGRAQALADILKMQYSVDEKPTMKVTISLVMKDLPSQTVFTALEGNTISFWLLRDDIGINFTQKKIENGSAKSLMDSTFKQINAGAVVLCENRSLDRQRSDFSSSREAVEETVQSLSCSVHSLQPLYDVLVSPIADLIQGDDLVFVPDGHFSLAPFSAMSDSVRIRAIPSLTALKLITMASDDFQSKNEALLVGDPCLSEVTFGNGEPMYGQLPCAKKEVDIIGELLQTVPLTGKNATKAEVLKRMKSVALIHIAAHGDDGSGEIALAPNPERTSQIPEEEDYMLSLSDVQAWPGRGKS